MVMVRELMVDGDEGGDDGLRIPPPGEKSWINLSPKMKIVGVVALCFANSPLLLGQPLFRIYEGVRYSRRRGVSEAPDGWAHAAKESGHVGPSLSGLRRFLVSIFRSMSFFSIKIDVVFFS